MYVLPSKGEAEKYAKDRLDKMIDICPVLQEVKSKKKGKSDTNTILRKEFSRYRDWETYIEEIGRAHV